MGTERVFTPQPNYNHEIPVVGDIVVDGLGTLSTKITEYKGYRPGGKFVVVDGLGRELEIRFTKAGWRVA